MAGWLVEEGAEVSRDECGYGSYGNNLRLWNLLGVGDVRVDNDSVFATACLYGHLPATQWLLQVATVDVYARDLAAFRWACTEGNLPVAKWLVAKCGVDPSRCVQTVLPETCSEVLGNARAATAARWLMCLCPDEDL